jgi:ATP/maltotriose-dependent transcriptional regulator MalT
MPSVWEDKNMARQPAPLAKLSRPRLFEALPRERLFVLLDAQQQRPVTLVAALPGAGKTTLVASYLESRKLAGIWYQVDAGDSDPPRSSISSALPSARSPAGRSGCRRCLCSHPNTGYTCGVWTPTPWRRVSTRA